MGRTVRAFTVDPLFVPVSEDQRRGTRARGAYTWPSRNFVSVVYLPDRARIEDAVYGDEAAEQRCVDSAVVRGPEHDTDKPGFDAVLHAVVGRVIGGLELPWRDAGIFIETDGYDDLRRTLAGASVARVIGADANVGQVTVSRVGTTSEFRVDTRRRPFIRPAKEVWATKGPMARQRHKVQYGPAKRAGVARTAVAAVLTGEADAVVIGDAWGNATMRNGKQTGGYGSPALLLDAFAGPTVRCPEPFTSRVTVTADGRLDVLANVSTFRPQGRKVPAGRAVPARTPVPPPTSAFLRGFGFNSVEVGRRASDGSVVVRDAEFTGPDHVREWSATRGHVVEGHVLAGLRRWRPPSENGTASFVAEEGVFARDDTTSVCGTPDIIVRDAVTDDAGGVTVAATATLIEVKSTTKALSWPVMVRWMCQIQLYLHLNPAVPDAVLVVLQFRPGSPYFRATTRVADGDTVPACRSGYRFWRIRRLQRFADVLATTAATEPGQRARDILLAMATGGWADVNASMVEVEVTASTWPGLPAHIRALSSPAACDGRRLRADIGASLAANFPTPFLHDQLDHLARGFVYVKHGVKWSGRDRRFVTRDGSAARAIAWQAVDMAQTADAVVVQVEMSGRTVELGTFVRSGLAEAAAAAGYDMTRFARWQLGAVKR